MKKMIAMAFVAVTMMTSCSDDDSSNTNDPEEFGLLPVTVVDTYSNGDTSTLNYNYDGNKITGYTATGGYAADYTYSNGLLTKMEMTLNNQLLEEFTFTYDSNGKLATRVKMWPEGGVMSAFKTVYTYNNNGTISLAYFTGNANEQSEPSGTSLAMLTNGNITSVTHYLVDGTESYTEMYTFDNKHTPYKNVFAQDVMVLSNVRGGVNNFTTNIIDVFPDNENVYEYTYNSENMPITSTTSSNDVIILETEIIYE